MLFRQIIHEDLGCASYLVGDPPSGVAVVVDPQWDIDPYLQLSRLHGVRIEHMLETHNHADHVSGHGRLARATGATIHVSGLADAGYEHEPFADGWTLELGDGVVVEAVHTPGHRPEHTSFLLRDPGRDGEPVAVLSGDSLFVGDVARPDLAVEPRQRSTRAPTSSSTRPTSPARSAPPPTTPASPPRSPRSYRPTASWSSSPLRRQRAIEGVGSLPAPVARVHDPVH